MRDTGRSLPGYLWHSAAALLRVVPTPVVVTIAVVTVAVGQLVVPRLGLAQPQDTVVRLGLAVGLFFGLLWATYVVTVSRMDGGR